MSTRVRKPVAKSNGTRKITIGIGLLPDELKQFDLQVKAESEGGIAATRSTLGRYAILKYLQSLKKQEATA